MLCRTTMLAVIAVVYRRGVELSQEAELVI